MAQFTSFSILVDQGNTVATLVIAIPNKGTLSIDFTGQGGSFASIASLAMDVARNGFWDAAQTNFYPPTSIRKISPQ